ncbi:MAG: hypothetical protein F6K04_02770 [Leptolyngbya sp. SIO4C5]|nr:hypothetical protein [Leptolyngbya sp. SIO4C5]
MWFKQPLPYALASTALAISSSLCPSPAQAQTSISGDASGIFVNPLPTGAVTSGSGTSEFSFGDPATFGTGANRFSFEALPFDTQTETDFLIGTFTYFNGTTTSGSQIDSVDLQIGLDFLAPAAGLETSTFGLEVISTINTSDPDASADAVLLPSSFSPTTFSLGGTEFTLQLLGFDNVIGDGFLTSTNTRLNVREGAEASAQLIGRVTSDIPDVPEPMSLLALVGLIPVGSRLLRRQPV